MRIGEFFRRFWPELLLAVAVVIPWLSLLALGIVWLWQGGHVWRWAIAAAVLSLLAWPLSRTVRSRANKEARIALGDIAEPSRGWTAVERDAWDEVHKIADATSPFAFTEFEPFLSSANQTIEAVARHFHPHAHTAWAQFSLPEALLLCERLARDLHDKSLEVIPGVRAIKLSHLLWVQRQSDQYSDAAQTGWRVGFGVWRMVRALLHPLQAVGQETSGLFVEKTATVLSYRLRAYATRLFVLEVGRAAIDLYSGRLALSDEEIRAARERDMRNAAAEPQAPVRIVLMGQVSAGKSSLLNALAREVLGAVAPIPTTSEVVEYRLDVEGHPSVTVVDMPGLVDGTDKASGLLTQAARADLIIWVTSATQPARAIDRKRLDEFRAWANAQLARRPPALILVVTHIDELRPATEWAPPYNVFAPSEPKARAIRAAIDAVGRALDLRLEPIIPVAMPPGQPPYNIDALWWRIAVALDQAKLVQLDRVRVGQSRLQLRELAYQVGQAGRMVIKGLVESP
jgi:predicted GTPase